ncbi:MAG: thiamine pyrophosphate-dependent enzyme [Anaeromyxobacteraceae bacterium]|nr:thiamine pyrophosphate-dependent enzyme [Anaeromyxobacteraceae bacterium]
MDRRLLSGDEAVAAAAYDAGVHLGTGYPGTPSTEILEAFDALGGRAQWAPNEKVAVEVGLGAAYGGARALVTMKHVGVNVAADPLFTAAYTGVTGALVVVCADDPGMSSSQNEQDSRRYAVAAGLPMLEPSDSQEAYDLALAAFELSARWELPVLFRMTTRVCHGKSIVTRRPRTTAEVPAFKRDIPGRVMIPAYARPAHVKLRQKLKALQVFFDGTSLNVVRQGSRALGIVANGVSAAHAREAAPGAAILELKTLHPLPLQKLREFAASVDRCVVVEEGDPVIADACLAAGLKVEGKPESFRFGELDVTRVRRILDRDESPEPPAPKGKPPQLCEACPYHPVYGTLRKLDCIVAGDIGCYTLGVLPPYQGMDACVAMGASLGVGLGLRHVLPEKDARRVVSIIGDSTFVHTGINGLVEMIYNPPATGHVLVVLDNGTTAMTGQQEHPGTGRTLDHEPTLKLSIEGLARALGVPHVDVIDPVADPAGFERLLVERLGAGQLAVIVARRPCILAAADIRAHEKANVGKPLPVALAASAVPACAGACAAEEA